MIVAHIFVNKTCHFVNKKHNFGIIFEVWGIKKEVKRRPGPPGTPQGAKE